MAIKNDNKYAVISYKLPILASEAAAALFTKTKKYDFKWNTHHFNSNLNY